MHFNVHVRLNFLYTSIAMQAIADKKKKYYQKKHKQKTKQNVPRVFETTHEKKSSAFRAKRTNNSTKYCNSNQFSFQKTTPMQKQQQQKVCTLINEVDLRSV